GLGRWLRDSSRVLRVHHGPAEALARRDFDVSETLVPGAARAAFLLQGSRVELCSRWLGAARLHEHRLPVARPALLVLGARRRVAWFEPPPPAERAASRAALFAALAERGLALASEAGALAQTPAGAYFLPPRETELV